MPTDATADPTAFAFGVGPIDSMVLPRITVPALVVPLTYDRAVHPRAGERFFALLGSSRKTYAVYAQSGHCMLVDSEREAICAQTWQFISSQ